MQKRSLFHKDDHNSGIVVYYYLVFSFNEHRFLILEVKRRSNSDAPDEASYSIEEFFENGSENACDALICLIDGIMP